MTWYNAEELVPLLKHTRQGWGPGGLRESDLVLGLDNHGDYLLLQRIGHEEQTAYWVDQLDIPVRPTHWMPLPKPPD